MSDCMTFPDTVEEFMEQYKITDTEQIYTNGAELIPVFRMKQWFEHEPEPQKGKWERYGHDFFGDNEYRCTACGETANIKTDFCPNCGADMRGENHETN